MQDNTEIVNVDGTNYTVIIQVKEKQNPEGIYDVLVRYVIEKKVSCYFEKDNN